MGVTVTTAEEFEAACHDWMEKVVKPAVVAAQLEVARAAAEAIVTAKATWNDKQPNDYWSGQFRASVTVAVGAPDDTAAPDNPGPWPIHPNPYPPADVDGMVDSLASIQAFQIVYIADAVPYAEDVESHVEPFGLAAAMIQSAFAPGYSWQFLADQSMAAIPF